MARESHTLYYEPRRNIACRIYPSNTWPSLWKAGHTDQCWIALADTLISHACKYISHFSWLKLIIARKCTNQKTVFTLQHTCMPTIPTKVLTMDKRLLQIKTSISHNLNSLQTFSWTVVHHIFNVSVVNRSIARKNGLYADNQPTHQTNNQASNQAVCCSRMTGDSSGHPSTPLCHLRIRGQHTSCEPLPACLGSAASCTEVGAPL